MWRKFEIVEIILKGTFKGTVGKHGAVNAMIFGFVSNIFAGFFVIRSRKCVSQKPNVTHENFRSNFKSSVKREIWKIAKSCLLRQQLLNHATIISTTILHYNYFNKTRWYWCIKYTNRNTKIFAFWFSFCTEYLLACTRKRVAASRQTTWSCKTL